MPEYLLPAMTLVHLSLQAFKSLLSDGAGLINRVCAFRPQIPLGLITYFNTDIFKVARSENVRNYLV